MMLLLLFDARAEVTVGVSLLLLLDDERCIDGDDGTEPGASLAPVVCPRTRFLNDDNIQVLKPQPPFLFS